MRQAPAAHLGPASWPASWSAACLIAAHCKLHGTLLAQLQAGAKRPADQAACQLLQIAKYLLAQRRHAALPAAGLLASHCDAQALAAGLHRSADRPVCFQLLQACTLSGLLAAMILAGKPAHRSVQDFARACIFSRLLSCYVV